MAAHSLKKEESSSSTTSTTKTTVLDAGTVESRGMGTKTKSRREVSAEIEAFLSGEAKFGWRSETRAFFTVWVFITRLPGPTWVDHHPGYLMRGMAYFPAAGALVGLFVSSFFDFAHTALGLPCSIAAAISTAASYWVTGCFHEDGLADSGDGLGGGWSREQILRIMTDTRLGTYGCAVLILYCFAKLELLAALGSSHWELFNFSTGEGGCSGAGPALVVTHALARLSSPYMIRTRDYVDEMGPKSTFYSFMVEAKYLVTWYRVLFTVMFCFGLVTLLYGPITAESLVIAVLYVAHLSGGYGERILGGVMGDFLGATTCVTELLVLGLIFILQKKDISKLFSQLVNGLSEIDDKSFIHLLDNFSIDMESMGEKMDEMWQHDQSRVVIRFLCVILLTALWTRFVGHRAVRHGADNTIQREKNDAVVTRSTTPTSVLTSKYTSPRSKAEDVLRSSSSTFSERYEAVRQYLDTLAKPVGSLGTLEDWAARLAALQRTTYPAVNEVACLIFAADHGAAAPPKDGGEGCSAYPQTVTSSVVEGLARGVAGASVLAKSNDVNLLVIDVGVNAKVNSNSVVKISNSKLYSGTKNLCREPAMTAEESERFIQEGRNALIQCIADTGANAVCLGEVGIGNTTSSSALIAALTGAQVESICDGGAFASHAVDKAAINKKISLVKKALALHGKSFKRPAEALAKLGGAEIASLVGAILEASAKDIPVLVDGFIVTAAALVAVNLSPPASRVLFFTSQSAEKGQTAAMQQIQSIAKESQIPLQDAPVLNMSMRMGEATAALLAVPILRSAADVLCRMATIEEILAPPNSNGGTGNAAVGGG